MLYIIHCFDKKDHLQVRLDNRPAHLEYAKGFGAKLTAAGPTFDADENMNGSLVILDMENLAEAEAYVANDPYARAGLFENVITQPWKKVLP